MFHQNLVILGGRIRYVSAVKITKTGQPFVWLRLASTPRKDPDHYRDPFDQWVMVIGRTAMMLSNNWAPGRTLSVQGVIRNTKPKVSLAQTERRLDNTYVKAVQVSFGDDRPSQAELLQKREQSLHTENDDQDDPQPA